MADSILRLKVESQEYDNKLKQATQGLTRYVDKCRKVGGTLEVVEKETLDYVRALGQMDTTSRTATGKLAEMKKTFTELSAQYKQMTDAEKQSPFGKALTIYQCIRYSLDKPGVLTVLPGAQSKEEVKKLLAYYEQPEDALDYSVVGTFAPPEASGKCVYCNHCKPCPVGIDIGLVNKYYDLAKSGDALAVEHYRTLEVNADNCIGCGHCDERCPFGVRQSERMSSIRDYFNSTEVQE